MSDSDSSNNSPPPGNSISGRSSAVYLEPAAPPPRLATAPPPSKLHHQQSLLTSFQNDYDAWVSNRVLLNSVDGSSDGLEDGIIVDIGESSRSEGLKKIVDLYNRESNDEMTNEMSEQEDNIDVNNDDTIDNSEKREPSQHYKQSEQESNKSPAGSKSNDNDASSATTLSAAVIFSIDQLIDVLFTPGMKYRGFIRIPGIQESVLATTNAAISAMNDYDDDDSDDGSSQDNSANNYAASNNHDSNNHNNANNNDQTAQTKQEPDGTYELVILKRSTDSLGNPYILAHHKADDDELAFIFIGVETMMILPTTMIMKITVL